MKVHYLKWLEKVHWRPLVHVLTIAQHLVVTSLPRTGIQHAELEVDRAFLFFKKQQILQKKGYEQEEKRSIRL